MRFLALRPALARANHVRCAAATATRFGFAFCLGVSACAVATPVSTGAARTPSGPTPAHTGTISVVAPNASRWPVKTEVHVDLWLHSFAMLINDNAAVPLFKRGYRDSVAAIKSASNTVTSLDANRAVLAQRLVAKPSLVQAQFLALSFNNLAELQFASEKFLQSKGAPTRGADATASALQAQIAAVFPTAADREWLRLFLLSVADENAHFYGDEYARAVSQRNAVRNAVDSLWQQVYRAKFERFLNNTGQRQGQLLLSLPVGAEGRTVAGRDRQTVIAVPFPGRSSDAIEPVLVFAHEAVGNLVSTVVTDNTTPAQQRSGESNNVIAFGQVQGGLLLLQRVAPELVESYARYYLAQGGRPTPPANSAFALRTAYPVPPAVLDALSRRLDIVLAGI